MTSIESQLLLFWAGAGLCFIGTLVFIIGYLFKKERLPKFGIVFAYLAAIPVNVALVLRWIQAGHYPYLGTYETVTSCAGVLLLFYLIIQLWKPYLRSTGTVVLPVTMLMIGLATTGATEITEAPDSYFTFWLWIHVLSAQFAYVSVIVAAALALLYLLKSNQETQGTVGPFLGKLPPLEGLDYLNYRFATFAFIMQGIMIASGSLWAFKAWGRYWGWDPIETWSLISWLVYGAYLHLRIMGIRGKAASWLGLAAILLIVFALFGAPLLYPTIHETLKIVR